MCAQDDAGLAGAAADLSADFHVHTAFAGGRDSVGVVVTAAERSGLRRVVFADQASSRTAWLPAYQSAIRRAQQRTDLALRIAVEVEVVREDGWIDLPADLTGLEAISVAVSHLPASGGPTDAHEVRAGLRAGSLHSADVVEMVLTATAAGIERASRYVPAQLARPLHLLGQVGIDADELEDSALAALASACRATGTAVELSEAWRTPSTRLAYRLAAAGVRLVAASDASQAAQLGQWEYLRSLLPVIERWGGAAVPGP